MDSIVKMSIDSRKNAFTNAYQIDDQKYLDKIEDLFKRISELGESCSDATDFETKFASSPLNQEYNDLFIEIGSKFKPITYESDNSNVQTTGEYLLEDARMEAGMIVDDITMPARHKARTEFDDKVRDTPVLGDAIQAKQTFDLFKRFKKNKNDEEE